MQAGVSEEFTPSSAAELARFLADNAAGPHRAMLPVGGRTAIRYGLPLTGPATLIPTTSLDAVADYPARDMTITVGAGIRVAELEQLLAAEGQRLPIDIPDATRATLGGAIATNTSGLGRFGHGTFRDYVIGVSAVDGQGRAFSGGGRVVKNVAGYDLCKLLVGSLGTLAVVTEVTLKLRPRPETRAAVWTECPTLETADALLTGLNTSATRPVAIELLNAAALRSLRACGLPSLAESACLLGVFYEGGERETRWQTDTLLAEFRDAAPGACVAFASDDANKQWAELKEFPTAGDDPVTISVSVPPSQVAGILQAAGERGAAAQAHAGNGVVIAHLPDDITTVEQARAAIQPLRKIAEAAGGSLVVWNCDDAWKTPGSVFGDERHWSPWMSRVKAALDPHQTLSPGRLPL
ncbi:MAG: FAD-binding oxidoreductase [Planctomyces sp.]|nr:FAD-binding oxidoreductase [Planctomyces sp.]